MTTHDRHPMDPRGLIREAFRIEGIGPEDCRSIFFDWAMGLDPAVDATEAARVLRAHHAEAPADHPMAVLLEEAAARGPQSGGRRRGGRKGR